jgi:hypothetical protein
MDIMCFFVCLPIYDYEARNGESFAVDGYPEIQGREANVLAGSLCLGAMVLRGLRCNHPHCLAMEALR